MIYQRRFSKAGWHHRCTFRSPLHSPLTNMNSIPTSLDASSGPGSTPLSRRAAAETRPDTPAAAVEDPRAEPADRAIHFEDLVERCMGNLELATRLLAQSKPHLASDLDLLREQAETAEPIEVARLAHRLKGAAASIGAYQLSDVFVRIEERCGLGDTATALDFLAELDTQWARFIACAAELCADK